MTREADEWATYRDTIDRLLTEMGPDRQVAQ